MLGRVGSEDVLRHLLNRLLGTSIVRLEYRNTEHPGLTEEERSSRFDVYCEDENGRCFQVEMQNWSQKYFYKRAIYYSSLVLMDQVAKAQREFKETIGKDTGKRWDYDFQPLYVVSFLNFKNWTSQNAQAKKNPYISTYRYVDIETREELSNSTNLVFIDLHSFNKKEEQKVRRRQYEKCLPEAFRLQLSQKPLEYARLTGRPRLLQPDYQNEPPDLCKDRWFVVMYSAASATCVQKSAATAKSSV